MVLLTKSNTSRRIRRPASLRSDGVRLQPGILFGFPSEKRSPSPESAIRFSGKEKDMRRILCVGVLATGIAALVAAVPADAQDFPDGPGKETFVSVCKGCHALDVVKRQRKTKAGWQASVDEMITQGAAATEE